MSTEFLIWPPTRDTGSNELEISERSSVFDIDVYGRLESASIAGPLTPKQLIDMALRLIQPALYHVDDVAASKARIIAAVSDMYS